MAAMVGTALSGHIFGWTRRRKSLAFSWCKPTIPTGNLTEISRMQSCRRWWSRSRGRRTYGYGSDRTLLCSALNNSYTERHTEKPLGEALLVTIQVDMHDRLTNKIASHGAKGVLIEHFGAEDRRRLHRAHA